MKAGLRIWIEMIGELFQHRELIWRLIVRDISAKYKQSFFGIFWLFLTPLVMMFVFVWIKSKNILPIDESIMPYPAFVFIGQMIWLIFSQGLIYSANCMIAAGDMLTKINFPREVLLFSAIGQTVFEFIFRIPLLIIVFLFVDFSPSVMCLFAPLAIIPLLFLVMGLGFFVSILNAVTRDTGNMIGIIVTLGVFATPVIYPPPKTWPLSFLINTINPVSGYINCVRDLTLNGSLTDIQGYFFSVIFSMLIFLIGWRIFHLVEPKIAERV